ncbi:MAG TPA: 2Fe-2S iron-sulfur cluster-binding protein [Planctomycetota bacterium]|nr:2Fe-2S iron-sulfur cluster-binding protein [Planctomycetota bacterium]
MGGTNPYIKPASFKKPERPYKLNFVTYGVVVDVDPSCLPYGRTGLPGSVLDIALAHGVPLDHACGGVVACSTCHVFVKQGAASCNEATDAELDQLDKAPGITAQSRLGCQCVPDGTSDVVVEIPEWNINQAREGAPGG